MSIIELQVGQGNVNVEAEVVEVEPSRTFEKFGKEGRVTNAKIKDESGEIKLTLWNEQIDQVQAGKKIRITNGYVSEFKGEKQLSTGRAGKIEVL